jgi:hypothetical protein
MYRNQLPRIYELRDMLPNPLPRHAYFRDLDSTLATIPQKLKQFCDVESGLQGLDTAAWIYLKAELVPLLTAKHETRGWQQLFDKLNQAKAYNYLVCIGCTSVRFIPESKRKVQRTPDLEALLQGRKLLCEVKTINVSGDEANRLHNGGVGGPADPLPEAFFNKLALSLTEAMTQAQACSTTDTKRIAYIIVNCDDRTREYTDRYRAQINHLWRIIQHQVSKCVLTLRKRTTLQRPSCLHLNMRPATCN